MCRAASNLCLVLYPPCVSNCSLRLHKKSLPCQQLWDWQYQSIEQATQTVAVNDLSQDQRMAYLLHSAARNVLTVDRLCLLFCLDLGISDARWPVVDLHSHFSKSYPAFMVPWPTAADQALGRATQQVSIRHTRKEQEFSAYLASFLHEIHAPCKAADSESQATALIVKSTSLTTTETVFILILFLNHV